MQTYAVNTIRSRLVILSAHLPMNEDSVNLVGNGFQKNEHWKKRNFERASDEGFFYWVLFGRGGLDNDSVQNRRQAIIFSNDDPPFSNVYLFAENCESPCCTNPDIYGSISGAFDFLSCGMRRHSGWLFYIKAYNIFMVREMK